MGRAGSRHGIGLMADSDLSDRRFERTSDIVAADVAGEIVLLHTKNWNYFEFDKIGAAIWQLLETPHSLPELIQALMSQFEVSESQCRTDTEAFLDEMLAEGLVEVR